MSKRVFARKDVNTKAVEAFVKDCAAGGVNLRAVQVVKNGDTVLKIAFAPYCFEAPMHLYSLSKSFTSVACGICCDSGLMSVDSRISELMPERMPEGLSEEAKNITLADLLSMQSGHPECKLYKMRWADDAVKTFFEEPLAYRPGEVFVYNTGATCVCAAAVEKVTGKKIVDFLDEKLFKKLGIKKPRWRECSDGTTLGGTGLYLSSDDITKFGVMLYNKGVYNGERIVSEEYLANATAIHSCDKNNGAPDWVSGYGFQFWRNARGGFRGDGAFGQLCLVFPEEGTVMTVMCESGNMDVEMKQVYKLLDSLYGGNGDTSSLEELSRTLYLTEKTAPYGEDRLFDAGENGIGLKTLRIFGDSLLHIQLGTDYGVHEFVCGNGGFILNHLVLRYLNPAISFLDPDFGTLERVSVFAAWERKDGTLEITLRHADTCHVQHWTVKDDGITVRLHAGDMKEYFFPLIIKKETTEQ